MRRALLLIILMFVGLIASPLRAQLTDVTHPGDPIVPTANNSLGGAYGAFASIDDDLQHEYVAFDKPECGFTVFPRVGLTVVSGLTLTSAKRSADGDPASYVLFGSYNGTNLTEISRGPVPAFSSRLERQTLLFTNKVPYLVYKLIFPTLSNDASVFMNIGEVELLGLVGPHDASSPADLIVASSTNSPASEGATNAIDDDQFTKYRNFDKLNAGFTVTLSRGPTVVIGVTLTSAILTSGNDGPERDPASYSLEGSNDGTNFLAISRGSVPPFPRRFYTHHIMFAENTNSFRSYRLLFPTVVNPATANSMAISEVELLAHIAPPERSRVTSLTYSGTEAFVTFTTSKGWAYSLEYVDDLNEPLAWIRLWRIVTGTGSPETMLDVGPKRNLRLYRVRVE